MRVDDRQEFLDRFYFQRGPCCAGCDWWRSLNSHAGECTRHAPVRAETRYAMLGIEGASLHLTAGHIMTRLDHLCGDFQDGFDWSTLPIGYRKRVGAPLDGSAERRLHDQHDGAAPGVAGQWGRG